MPALIKERKKERICTSLTASSNMHASIIKERKKNSHAHFSQLLCSAAFSRLLVRLLLMGRTEINGIGLNNITDAYQRYPSTSSDDGSRFCSLSSELCIAIAGCDRAACGISLQFAGLLGILLIVLARDDTEVKKLRSRLA